MVLETSILSGTREGFADVVSYPKIAACAGPTLGFSVTSTNASNTFCDAGWHICTGAEIDMGRGNATTHTSITLAQARSFTGCFAYNADNDCNSCSDTCGARTDGGHSGTGCNVSASHDADVAGMGSGCSYTTAHACIADGRINSGNHGCTIDTPGITGFVCCRADYLELSLAPGPVSTITSPITGGKSYLQVINTNEGVRVS